MRDKLVIRSEHLREQVVCERLDSGLEVCTCSKPGFAKKYALLATRYGSNDVRFRVNGAEVDTPAGIAHFLEHKLFEEEEGSIDDVFAELGAYSNAFTNYNTTAYLFSCTDEFERSLKTLVDFVYRPHFTAESVEREKDIIEQEIRMGDDQPGWQIVSELMKSMYHAHPVRHDIAGTVESVRAISVDVLNKCYSTFYHPSNMTLFAVGDIEHGRVVDLVAGEMERFTHGPAPEVERVRPFEPGTVARARHTRKMAVSRPLVCMGFKDADVGYAGEKLSRKVVTCEILLSILAGRSSDLFMSMYNDGIIDTSFSWDYSFDRDYAMVTFDGRTPEPEAFVQRLVDGIGQFRRTALDLEAFERVRRMLAGTWVREFNSLEAITYQFIDYHFLDMSIFDRVRIASSVTEQEVKAMAEKLLNEPNMSVSVVMPA